jgi:hypothetical protein
MRNEVTYIDKHDFLEAYYAACIVTINTHNIYSSFADIGLVSNNPERVLLKLHI